ncbi:hypothetical protein AVDCRST_MAG81-3538 [uncultured Synechococcales cyanobacterium]|uniref:Uncharacterized protein n=1 Tax=uncultured Synechococcales cyanobacterium TaxID=1936017 RepID=A0A6J4VQI0_9CYAN|nr:hypothetical protein AVDCRST_MAG81-3538 [uncultured Synechococcales cyanobacterium]
MSIQRYYTRNSLYLRELVEAHQQASSCALAWMTWEDGTDIQRGVRPLIVLQSVLYKETAATSRASCLGNLRYRRICTPKGF